MWEQVFLIETIVGIDWATPVEAAIVVVVGVRVEVGVWVKIGVRVEDECVVEVVDEPIAPIYLAVKVPVEPSTIITIIRQRRSRNTR